MTQTQYRFNAETLDLENWEGQRIHVLSILMFLGMHCFNWTFDEPQQVN